MPWNCVHKSSFTMAVYVWDFVECTEGRLIFIAFISLLLLVSYLFIVFENHVCLESSLLVSISSVPFSNRSLGISIESISAIEINMMLFLEQKCLRRRNFQDKIVLIQNCSVRQCSRTRIFKMKISEMKIFKIKNFEEKMFNMRMFTKNRWHPEEEHLQNIIFDDYYLWNSFQSLSFVHEKSMRSSLFLSPHDWNIHFK